MYNKIVIGLDQSYKNTGISIGCDGKLKKVSSVWLDKLDNNTLRRDKLRLTLEKVLESNIGKSRDMVLMIERIRLQSQGFINMDYIKGIGALNTVIVDTGLKYGIKTYSVDTRSWKSQIVGSSKPLDNKYGIDPEKWRTILYIKSLGFENSILYEVSKQKKKGVIVKNGIRYTYNDDAADSAGICLYGFLPLNKQKIEEEH
jgi:hypothetical protein